MAGLKWQTAGIAVSWLFAAVLGTGWIWQYKAAELEKRRFESEQATQAKSAELERQRFELEQAVQQKSAELEKQRFELQQAAQRKSAELDKQRFEADKGADQRSTELDKKRLETEQLAQRLELRERVTQKLLVAIEAAGQVSAGNSDARLKLRAIEDDLVALEHQLAALENRQPRELQFRNLVKPLPPTLFVN